MGSPGDYKSTLLSYASKLADDNLLERADEVVRELCGPVFWDPSVKRPEGTAKWDAKVLGMEKRGLLKEILPVLGEHFSFIVLWV